jgi:CRISPR-associated protein Cmr1
MSLVELELELETPLLIGGYDPLKLDEIWFLRPSEVKGIWRWWARALVAGALYDAGKLKGQNASKGVLKVPSSKEVEEISKIVGKDMGLGYADPQGKSSEASNYSIIVTPLQNVEKLKKAICGDSLRKEDIKNLQRISLLCLKGKERTEGIKEEKVLEYLEPGARFLLRVEKHLPTEHKGANAALSALSLALTFNGFGKGGRRGLGCFRVVSSSGKYAELFEPKLPAIEKLNNAITAVRDLLKIKVIEEGVGELPPLPLISARRLAMSYTIKEEHVLRPFQVLEVSGDSSQRILTNLHNFFLRGARVKQFFKSYKAMDNLREKYNAWVLGLPRKQKIKLNLGGQKQEEMQKRKRQKIEVELGYFIKSEDIERRASPFILALHGNIAYLSVFVSADWPRQLEWVGNPKIKKNEKGNVEKVVTDSQLIELNEAKIVDAIIDALKEFIDYAKKCGFRWILYVPKK